MFRKEQLTNLAVLASLSLGMVSLLNPGISLSEMKRQRENRISQAVSLRREVHPLEMHMLRVQQIFDSSSFSNLFKQDAFIAKVLNIRELKPSDTLVGSFSSNDSQVVILGITASGNEDGTPLKIGKTIAYPVNTRKKFWKSMISRDFGQLFEFNRFKDRVEILKFGC